MPNPGKYLNLLKSGASFLASPVFKYPVVYGMPATVSIELTNCCNLACPECVSGSGTMTRSRGYIDPVLFRDIIQQLRPYLYMLNLHFQGEPMLHPDFFSLADVSRGTITTLHTNGHFLNEENSRKLVNSGIRNLIVSVDGMDQPTYSAYRVKGDLSKVLTGIENLATFSRESGSHTRITMQMLVNRHNEHQTGKAREFASQNHIRLSLKSMQVLDPAVAEKWMPTDGRFRRYKLYEGRYTIKSKLPRNCARLWFNPVITWDGFVVPCCFDKNANHIMGDLKKESFRSIWYGEKYRVFRSMLLHDRKKIPMCLNCTSGIPGVKT